MTSSWILRFQGLIEIAGPSLFIIGFFIDSQWMILLGGGISVLYDVLQIAMGVLNPLFPFGLAIILVFIFSPWYIGVFWGSAGFGLLNIPTAMIKVFSPCSILPKSRYR